jgi:hypothetical protein
MLGAEARQESLGIASWSITSPTLEEAYIRLGDQLTPGLGAVRGEGVHHLCICACAPPPTTCTVRAGGRGVVEVALWVFVHVHVHSRMCVRGVTGVTLGPGSSPQPSGHECAGQRR